MGIQWLRHVLHDVAGDLDPLSTAAMAQKKDGRKRKKD